MNTPWNKRIAPARRLPSLPAVLFTVLFVASGGAARGQVVQTGQPEVVPMKIVSTDFSEGGPIPKRCTCNGENASPELNFKSVPAATKSLVLIVDDPDAPSGTATHWLLWNLKPDPSGTLEILANSPPQDAVQGLNYKGQNGYTGPCPPSGTHRYHFRVFALDIALRLPPKSDRKVVEKAMDGHVLAKAELIGTSTHGAQ